VRASRAYVAIFDSVNTLSSGCDSTRRFFRARCRARAPTPLVLAREIDFTHAAFPLISVDGVARTSSARADAHAAARAASLALQKNSARKRRAGVEIGAADAFCAQVIRASGILPV